jgi:hypothetical protein
VFFLLSALLETSLLVLATPCPLLDRDSGNTSFIAVHSMSMALWLAGMEGYGERKLL